MNIVLYQPDIALNVGAIIRLVACFNSNLHIVEPCGFPFDIKKIKQSSLDYIDHVNITRYSNWDHFLEKKNDHAKLLLLSTKASKYYHQISFSKNDYIIFGSESRGASEEVWKKIDDYAFGI